MKRLIACILVVATLATSVLGGCSMVTRGSDYCYKFLDYICNSEFDKAYEMIADSLKAPETEEEKTARLKEENAAKEEKQKFWKELFGISDEGDQQTPKPDETGTPNPEETVTPNPKETVTPLPEATPDPNATPNPADGIVTPTPEAALQNGMTPDPETGEYPEVEASPTPDPNATPTPQLANEPGSTPIPEGGPTPTPEPKTAKKNQTTPEPDTAPTPTPVPTDADGNPILNETITKVEFIEKYQSIFDELQLTGIDYETTSVTDGEIVAYVDYDLTYHSKRALDDPDIEDGKLTYTFKIEAQRIEHRWAIMWSPNLIFPMMEWGDSLRVGTLQANRGEILCDGVAYAQNVSTITVFAVPSKIPDTETFIQQVAAISEMEMTEQDIRDALTKQRNDFCKLQTFYPDEMTAGLQQQILAVEGLSIDTANYGSLRYYPYGQSLCHIIGYAGIISKKEKINYETYGDIIYNNATQRYERIGDTRYNGDSYIGKYGLELLYEDKLLGTNGRFTYIQDTKGGSRGMLYRKKAVEGNDLHLTINPQLQERLEDVIQTTVYDSSMHGCVLVFNPKTGAILSLTSWPGFDLNYLSRGMPIEEWEALQKDPTIPLFNRATQGVYTPGSIFKPMTCAALLETNTLTVNDVFPGSEEINNDEWVPSETFMATLPERADERPFHEQANEKALKRTRSDSRPTPMNMTNSVISSDNLFFAYCALRMGWTKYYDYFKNKLHWEDRLTLEADGTLPRVSWKVGADGYSWQNVAEGGETIWEQDESGNWVEMKNFHPILDTKIDGMDVSTSQLYASSKALLPADYKKQKAEFEANPENAGKTFDLKSQTDYDLAVTGYGQGQILVTPLQMAYWLSAYANNGDVMQPYVVDSIWHADGTNYDLVEQREPKMLHKQLINQTTVETLMPGLKQVCQIGTARSLAKSFLTKVPLDPGYVLAGKTGTAEINNDKTKELAWFGCWRQEYSDGTPIDDKDARMVVIMLEVDLPTMQGKPEWAQMKFDIARAMLKKDDILNDYLRHDYRCNVCGWEIKDVASPPAICPSCGDAITEADMVN